MRCQRAARISTCAIITCGRPSKTGSSRAMAHVWSSARTSCARPSVCLSRRSGVPSALGHIGCCSATRLVADTSRAEPADQGFFSHTTYPNVVDTSHSVSGHLLVPCVLVQVGLHLQSCVHFLHWLRGVPSPPSRCQCGWTRRCPFLRREGRLVDIHNFGFLLTRLHRDSTHVVIP